MSTILIILVLLLVFGGGWGGYQYYRDRQGNIIPTGATPGFNFGPVGGIVGLILLVVVLLWLFGMLPLRGL